MINLEKGQRISMDKGLSLVGVGLGWDPNEGSGYDFDLDASAFMLGSNGKIPKDEFFVFYNNQKSPDGSVESMGDNLDGTGTEAGDDDETINVDLKKLILKFRKSSLRRLFIRLRNVVRTLVKCAILTFVFMM